MLVGVNRKWVTELCNGLSMRVNFFFLLKDIRTYAFVVKTFQTLLNKETGTMIWKPNIGKSGRRDKATTSHAIYIKYETGH